MKFGEEIVTERVPEWADKYLDYKTGKKHIKAIADAIQKAESGHRPDQDQQQQQEQQQQQNEPLLGSIPELGSPLSRHVPPSLRDTEPRDLEAAEGADPPTIDSEQQRYGDLDSGHVSFASTPSRLSGVGLRIDVAGLGLNRQGEAPSEVDPPPADEREHASPPRRMMTRRGRAVTALLGSYPFSAVRTRFFDGDTQPLNPSDPVEQRKSEFFHFAILELQKVEAFYRTKEKEAGARIQQLRDQLYEMRNRRGDEVFREDMKKKKGFPTNGHQPGLLERVKGNIIELTTFAPGPNSKALRQMPPTPILTSLPSASQRRRDFVPKQADDEDIPYPEAKKKLKTALQEFYRSLDLIQGYSELNRTAFRKLNKKYDKNARTDKLQFMRDYVDQSNFVKSTVIDGHMKTTEDLFARYFEQGNSKAALTKLRARKVKDESMSTFWNGLLVGTGFVFAIQGLISGARHLFNEDLDDDEQKAVASHLQLYGGYFLMLCLFWLFCLVCWVWTITKVNYPFIFEFDPAHSLDWRKLAQFPSFFTLLFGVIFWLNFSGMYGGKDLFLWYPAILIALSLFLIFLPLPVWHHRSRKWFAYAHWRLLMAPFYSVEFRDVFLGDIYCSLSYSISNIDLFFCVYASGWEEPEKCGSSQSRLVAFLSALPPMWRAIQCLRRYYDARSFFPHLANFGKYIATIFGIVTLSLYRINRGELTLSLFIFFSTFNTIYSSFWDIYMDFRLAQKKAKYYLRDILAFKSHRLYYAIMIVDPLLRMTWVFHVIWTHNIQHSGIVSFVIAFIEIIRRAAWASFRLENEHCVNIANNKASRDIALPYKILPTSEDDG
ncbi:EXS family-domain-containing protein [Lasiosphaeria hispida]|uniref:EXS family-domain-containing protein n=1 Tax=Lasiosphaeria hispida TaxID=260671 RepID=A0AAJ0HJF0_9PEZI|nr:EXS family-domain-containing protein [Lasiosphaeria hispida]